MMNTPGSWLEGHFSTTAFRKVSQPFQNFFFLIRNAYALMLSEYQFSTL